MEENTVPQRLVLFDGVCVFCSFWVRFLIRRDPEKRFRFAPLQSEMGRRILKKIGLPADELNTMVFLEGERPFLRSSAALRIARNMRGLWPALYVFIVVPPPLRDFLYGLVAKSRYRLFGKMEFCMVPTPDLKERFLD